MNDERFLLGYIARQPHVTTGEALALAATDPVLPAGVRALAAETALDTGKPCNCQWNCCPHCTHWPQAHPSSTGQEES